MVPPEPPSDHATRSSPWVRGPVWDLFWLHGGLWLAPLAVLTSLGWEHPDDSPAHIVYLVLAALFWIGHRFSSTWLAWFTTAYADIRRAQPVRFFWVPGGIMLATAVVVFAPDSVLPGTWMQRVVVLGAIDYLLVTYHFAAQHFGVLSLYRSRAGGRPPTGVRTLDQVFALVVGGGVIVVAELIQGATTLPDAWLGSLSDTSSLTDLRWPVAVLTAGLTALQLSTSRTHTPGLPRQLYALGLGAMALAALLAHPFVYIFCWTAQHWLAAVGLAAVVVQGEPAPRHDRPLQRVFHLLNRPPGRFILVLALLSALSMPLYEVEASSGPADRPAFVVLDAALGGLLTAPGTLRALTALGLATAFLHYLLDRAVWRFSDPAVRRAAAPLLRPPQP